jgi:hypothetical protein
MSGTETGIEWLPNRLVCDINYNSESVSQGINNVVIVLLPITAYDPEKL